MKRFQSIAVLFMTVVMTATTFAGCSRVEPAPTKAPEAAVTEETSEDYLEMLDVDPEADESLGLFPQGTTILGIDVSNLTAENAYLKVTNRLNDYRLSVTVNGQTVDYTAENFALTLSISNFEGVLKELSTNPQIISTIEPELVVYDEDAVISEIEAFPGITSTAKNAYIKYDKAQGKFISMPEENGYGIDIQPIVEEVGKAIQQNKSSLNLNIESSDVTPMITQDCDKIRDALNRANSLLNLSITYVFNPATGSKHTDKLSSGEIASMLYVKKDGLTVAVDSDAVDKFVSKKASQRGVFGQSVGFTTTAGTELSMNAVATGELVDTSDLYDDLNKRLSKGISGTHNAVYYIVRPGDVSGNYGGNYVEINLTQQHAWCYKNGAVVVSTDVVTGCVRAGNKTPTGVYQIRGKARNTYLVGPTWRNFVSYWMPFNGGIGLHDADRWRKKYGGTIYLRNGSHGCVNMPLNAAKNVYANVSKGTHVIVYGGSGSASPQKIVGTTSYTVNVGDKPFYVDAKPLYTAPLTFSSSNNSVVKVDSTGKVTVVGEGTAKITVKCKDDNTKLTVTVTVYPKGVAPPSNSATPTATPTTASPTTTAATTAASTTAAATTQAASETTKAADPTETPTETPATPEPQPEPSNDE